jgi:hypothetical protein
VAVNANDSESIIQKYVQEGKFTFPIVMGGSGPNYTLGKAYGVQAYPTNYLIGPDGKILWRSLGFDEAGLRQAIKDAGVQ